MSMEQANLISNEQTINIIKKINTDYKSISSQLKNESLIALTQRLKAYDNFQRFTFGRIRTEKIKGKVLLECLYTSEHFKPIYLGDPSQFPLPFSKKTYPGFWEAIVYTVEFLKGNVTPEEDVFVLAFYHRVLVRPNPA